MKQNEKFAGKRNPNHPQWKLWGTEEETEAAMELLKDDGVGYSYYAAHNRVFFCQSVEYAIGLREQMRMMGMLPIIKGVFRLEV